MNTLYHLTFCATWIAASRNKQYPGSPNGHSDTFIQLSPRRTQAGTNAACHRVKRDNILLASIDAKRLGPNSLLEINTSGEPVPHFFGKSALNTALAMTPPPLDKEGNHEYSPDIRTPNDP